VGVFLRLGGARGLLESLAQLVQESGLPIGGKPAGLEPLGDLGSVIGAPASGDFFDALESGFFVAYLADPFGGHFRGILGQLVYEGSGGGIAGTTRMGVTATPTNGPWARLSRT